MEKIKSSFEKFYQFLSRINPLVFLCSYLLAIPGFGFIYYHCFPHDFYAPYARLEPSAQSDRQMLETTLQSALRRAVEERKDEEFVVDDWKLDLSTLQVDNIKSDDGTQLYFTTRFTATGIGRNEGGRSLGWSIVVKISDKAPYILFKGPNMMTYFRFPEMVASDYAIRFQSFNKAIFELIFAPIKAQSSLLAPALALNIAEESQLRNYINGIRGDASGFSGTIFRMTYFSAVVIKTLGLGDIVPMSNTARSVVAIEAIWGIILAGLFINSIAYRASKRSD